MHSVKKNMGTDTLCLPVPSTLVGGTGAVVGAGVAVRTGILSDLVTVVPNLDCCSVTERFLLTVQVLLGLIFGH